MKDEVFLWLKFARENFDSATILFQSKLYNPCLQNIQQCVEKTLKALLIQLSLDFPRTHDVLLLRNLLLKNGLNPLLSDDDCDFLNSIYLPSKYPLGSVLADFEPDEEVCSEALLIATKIMKLHLSREEVSSENET